MKTSALDSTSHATRDAAAPRMRHLECLARVAQELILPRRKDTETLDTVLKLSCEAFGAEMGWSYAAEPGNDTLRLAAAVGFEQAHKDPFTLIRAGVTRCGRVAESRARVLESGPAAQGPESDVPTLGGPCYAGFPLVAEDRLLGTLAFSTRSRDRFGDDELAVMATVAAQTAATLETARVLVELRGFGERFRTAVSVVSSLIWTNNAAGQMEGEQPGWAAFTGQSVDEYQGYGWASAVHPDDAQPTVEAWNIAVAEKRTFVFEHRVRRRDGAWRLFSVRAAPLLDPAGSIREWVGVHTDITDRVDTEAELRRHREQLQHLVDERTRELVESHEQLRMAERLAMMGTLSAGLGHDMGNLLVPVRIRLESLAETPMPEHAREDLRAIGNSADALQRLANGLRLLASDPGRVRPAESTDLRSWWADASGVMKSVLPRSVTLEARVPDDECGVRISRAALTQAVFNLVQNAGESLKSNPGGVVCIVGGRRDGGIVLSISDNGPGMSPEVKARCMEPFFTTKSRGISTGLGLPLVYGLVLDAGGTIEIESQVGRGTTFLLHLPAAAAAPHEAAFTGRAVLDLSDPRLRSFVAGELRSLNYGVESFSDGDALADVFIIDDAEKLARIPQGASVVFFGDDPPSRASNTHFMGGKPRALSIRNALREITEKE